MDYYDEIKEQLIKSEIYDRAKDYSKDRHKVKVYFETGKLLSEAGKEYGKKIIKQYSEKLMVEVGKKYNERTLRRIRQFYDVFANENWSTMWTKLCWSHYREVLSLKDMDEIRYYLNECQNKNLTQRQLHELIKHNTYNRLSDETKTKLIESKKIKYDLDKNYSVRLLYKMIKYYNFVSEEKLPTLSAKLSWSHYDEVLRFNDINKIAYYMKISEQQNLSIRQLRSRIKSNEYERLPGDTKNKLVSKEVTNIVILEDIPSFLDELGS